MVKRVAYPIEVKHGGVGLLIYLLEGNNFIYSLSWIYIIVKLLPSLFWKNKALIFYRIVPFFSKV
ncbi:MAG: hypothetical protein ACTJHC_06540 [Vagococcus sp.]